MDLLASIFSGEDSREKQYLRVTGKYNFHIEPVIKGILPYHSCTVVITCFRDSRKIAPIDFKCEWFRVIEDRYYKIEDNDKESYHFNPYDIGGSIKCIVTSTSIHVTGTVQIMFGPILMDYALRTHIKETVQKGSAEFKTKLIQMNDNMITDNIDFDDKVILGKSEIVVKLREHKDIKDTQMHIPYERSLLFRIECDNHDPKTLTIYFEQEDKEIAVKLQFISRVARDLFIMSMRVIKVLRISCVTDMVNSYGKILSKEWLPKKLNPDDGEDYYERFQADTKNIRTALKMIITANKEISAENEKLMECIEILESDLQFSIGEFTNLLQEMKAKGAVDIKKYEDISKSIALDSSGMINRMKDDPNSSFNIKRSAKDQNIHNRKRQDVEQLAGLQSDYDNVKRLNTILESELTKLRASKGLKADQSINMHSSMIKANEQRRKASDDEEDGALGMTLENVLADLEDVDYKTYKISKEEIDKYKETMKLRMEFIEEKRSHEILNMNLEHIKQTKQTAIADKQTFNINQLALPDAARAPGVTEEQLLAILQDVIKENYRLSQQNIEASKANLDREQSSDELIELKLKYLLKKSSTLDEQSEKAEEELTASIINHFKKLDANKGPAFDPKVMELTKKKEDLAFSNQLKAQQIEQEKAKNASVKAELEKINSDKKVYTEKSDKIKALQSQVNTLMEKLDKLQNGEEETPAENKVDWY